MNYKQMLGLILLSIGAVLILFVFSAKGYIPDANVEIDKVTSSPISPTEHFPESISSDADTSPEHADWILIIGIAMVFVGGLVVVRHRIQ